MGLIPAAGRGSRLGNLPFSKELLPLSGPADLSKRPRIGQRAAIDHSLECLAAAGINSACVVLSTAKADLRRHLDERWSRKFSLDIVTIDDSPNVPSSLNAAFPAVRDIESILMFPDIVFSPIAAVRDILNHMRESSADIVLALVPAASGEKIDIVFTENDGRISAVIPKPGAAINGWTWVAAAWTARFTDFMFQKAQVISATVTNQYNRETYMADVFNDAIDIGFSARAVVLPDGMSFDLGTLDELHRYWEIAGG